MQRQREVRTQCQLDGQRAVVFVVLSQRVPRETQTLKDLDVWFGLRSDFDVTCMVAVRRAVVGEGEQLKVGTPLVSGARVKATVLAHGRGDKVKIFKLRRRKHYQKTQGHRQSYTEVRVDDIVQG